MGHLTHIANHVVEQMDKGTNADRIKEAFQGKIRKQYQCKALISEINLRFSVKY